MGLIIAAAIMVSIGTTYSTAWAQDPVPFECTGEAFTVRYSPAELFRINQSVSPFTFIPINLNGPGGNEGNSAVLNLGAGDIPIELNNLGFRKTDGLLYAMALKPFAGVFGLNGNYGIVQIDSNGDIFGPLTTQGDAIPSIINSNYDNNYRFAAGDVSINGTTMYINSLLNAENSTGSTGYIYIVDLTTTPPTVKAKQKDLGANVPEGVNVADWAVNPTDQKLYGASKDNGHIYKLDPDFNTSHVQITRVTTSPLLPTGLDSINAFGGVWFNSLGRAFFYRNVGEIYEVDFSDPTPKLLSIQFGGPESVYNDAAACAADPEPEPDNPAIDIEKTVYEGHDSGAGAPGGDIFEGLIDDLITYVFTVTNTGNVDVTLSTFEDSVLLDSLGNPIDGNDLTPPLGDQTLIPGESLEFYYETTIDIMVEPWLTARGSLPNTACVVGTADTLDQTEVYDCDDAAVLVPDLCADPEDPSDGEGCTPGYWKANQHHDSWVGYTTDQYFDVVFGVGPNITLLNALKVRNTRGEGALIRHAVAALLNAASVGVDYFYTIDEVKAWVQAAYASGDFELHKDHLEMENERLCPLN